MSCRTKVSQRPVDVGEMIELTKNFHGRLYVAEPLEIDLVDVDLLVLCCRFDELLHVLLFELHQCKCSLSRGKLGGTFAPIKFPDKIFEVGGIELRIAFVVAHKETLT